MVIVTNALSCMENEECGSSLDMEGALEWWKKSGEIGYAPSMAYYATRIRVSEVKTYWLEQAWKSNDAFTLGWLEERERRDALRAMEWYKQVQGICLPWAQERLGVLCHLRSDYEGAMLWYRQGASGQRLPNCLYAIGDFMASGRGCKKDVEGSLEWMREAAAQGHYVAQYHLSHLLMERDEIDEGTHWAMRYTLHSEQMPPRYASRLARLCQRTQRLPASAVAVARELALWGSFFVSHPNVQVPAECVLARDVWLQCSQKARAQAALFLGIARKRRGALPRSFNRDVATLVAKDLYEQRFADPFPLLDAWLRDYLLAI